MNMPCQLRPCAVLGSSDSKYVVTAIPVISSVRYCAKILFFFINHETYLSCSVISLPDWRFPVIGSMVNVSSGNALGSSMKKPESLQFICSPTSGNPSQRVSFILSRFCPGQHGVAALAVVANPTNIHCIAVKKH